MSDVVTIGESLVALIPDSHTKLRYVQNFTKTVAGAESNVAVGLAKLGHRASWLGGEDIFLDSTRRRECIHTNRRREPLNCT